MLLYFLLVFSILEFVSFVDLCLESVLTFSGFGGWWEKKQYQEGKKKKSPIAALDRHVHPMHHHKSKHAAETVTQGYSNLCISSECSSYSNIKSHRGSKRKECKASKMDERSAAPKMNHTSDQIQAAAVLMMGIGRVRRSRRVP